MRYFWREMEPSQYKKVESKYSQAKSEQKQFPCTAVELSVMLGLAPEESRCGRPAGAAVMVHSQVVPVLLKTRDSQETQGKFQGVLGKHWASLWVSYFRGGRKRVLK